MNPIKSLSLPICVSCILGSVILATGRAQGTVPATRVRTLTAEQEEILSHMSIVYLDDGVGGRVKTIRLTKVNWQIVDGSGTTDGATTGVGNLIVGYNEQRYAGDERTGSHNMIGGIQQNYTSHGGFVMGFQNTISGSFASVTGGRFNTASGDRSSVSGGFINMASGFECTVSGGIGNTASGGWSAVSGGGDNTASGTYASISGGNLNMASGPWSSVSGGYSNMSTSNSSSVSGGGSRSATGWDDWVAGTLFENF